MWIATHQGSLVNLETANRIYIDGLGRLLITYEAGEIVVLADTYAHAVTVMTALRALVGTDAAGFTDVLTANGLSSAAPPLPVDGDSG